LTSSSEKVNVVDFNTITGHIFLINVRSNSYLGAASYLLGITSGLPPCQFRGRDRQDNHTIEMSGLLIPVELNTLP